ncbi:uncharacterized protein [Chelonus insularis]|uniref:uncharacterized protein n=1 Tax=Chelonus insularis TaxID=460826 RepID=UPI00158E9689|nr:uncharacterized protein LOC118066508 [Chelonus insularis]
MNLKGFKVFLCLFVGYNLFTVVTPFAPLQERTFHPALRQHAEFGEGVRDWFRGVRDKVRHFFKPTTTTPSPPPVEIESVKKEIMNKFFLDLANTRFNPDRDWGFRMGSWYFIKKVDDSSDDKFPDYVPTTTTTESVDEVTREREELITSTPAQPSIYTEEIETLDHGRVDSTSLNPVENTENSEKIQPEHTIFTTDVSTIAETTIGESFMSTQESVGVNDINTSVAPTTQIVETRLKHDNENEIPMRDPLSAEVISPQ